MQIKYKTKKGEYLLESTNYGVDIFINNSYLTTIEDSEKKPQKEWIKIGIDYIQDLKDGPM
jgi:hypothetical protein